MTRLPSSLTVFPTFAAIMLACIPAWGHAEDGSFKASGFLSLIGGRIYGTNPERYEGPEAIAGHACPCYIADWSNAGIYEETVSLTPESRAGLQLKYTVNPQFHAAAQLVIRGSDRRPRLEWAYASYAPSRNVEIQIGRKRIPLYFYSDFQDIGSAYPWVGAPPELYGWEVTNYNGASFRYRADLDGTAVSASVFVGRETAKDSFYQRLYYEDRTDVSWNGLRGADFEINHGPLTLRAVFMQTGVHTRNSIVGLDETARLKAYGIAANLEFDRWLVLSEFTQLTRDFDAGHRAIAPAFTIGVGYRYGNWTPFINFARYKERSDAPDLYTVQSIHRSSLTLRYDINSQSSVKGQIDRHTDRTRNFGGDATIVRLAYDRLF